jgi:hypothetical protein
MIRSIHTHDQSIGSLLKDLTDESRMLLHKEVELAKVEISEKVSTIGRNIVYLVICGAVLYAGLLTLIGTAAVGLAVSLSRGMSAATAAWLGPLIVGVVVCVAGYILVQKALRTLKSEGIVPHKTIDSLRENTEWLKDQMRTSENRMTAETTIR